MSAGVSGGDVVPAGAGGMAGTPTNPANMGGASGMAGNAMAGAGGMAGNAMAGSGGMGEAGSTPVDPGADRARDPIIPPVMGECPAFTTGTKTVLGLSGISFRVGTKVTGKPTGPIVFYWHGTGSTSAEGNRFPGISEIVEKGGVFVSFARSKGTGGDCSGTGTFSQDDFKVADQIVACAVKEHNADPRQIYATGCSAGGLFAGCMAIERSSYLAATVPNSGGITIGYGPIQDPKRVPAVMTMHGGPGDVVIVTFSQTSQAYDSYMLKKGSPMVINCDHGGGHCAAPSALYASGWQFMKDHPFGTNPSPYKAGLPSGFHSSCKIWTDTSLTPLGRDPMGMPKTPVVGEPVPPATP